MPFVPDSRPASRQSRFVPDASAMPRGQRTGADPFAGDSLLSDEAIASLAGGERSTVLPSTAPRPLAGAKRYVNDVESAAAHVRDAKGPGVFGIDMGSLEAAGTLLSGGIAAPLLGTAESIALGTDPEKSFARYTYQPRTESGKAQLGLMGAVARPITDSGLDVALGPLFAGESRAVAGGPAKIPFNARRNIPRPDHVPGQPGAVVGAVDDGAAIRQSAPQAERAAGLERVSKTPPTIEELSKSAKDAYKRASDAGITVSPESFGGLKTKITETLRGEGIDPTLHPSTTAALKRITEADGALTLDNLETLRKISKDAQNSTAPADRRLASILVDEIDDYVNGLAAKDVTSGDPAKAAALAEARNFYSRKAKAEEIRGLIDRAEISAPNFSASGMENALRTEFRALAKNEKRMRRFTAEEQESIRRVATGGNAENALRMLGKFAPTGVVSAGLSSGLGFIAGGPVGAAALPAVGAASRYGATKMTMRNARLAEELMRRGPQESGAARQTAKRRALGAALTKGIQQ